MSARRRPRAASLATMLALAGALALPNLGAGAPSPPGQPIENPEKMGSTAPNSQGSTTTIALRGEELVAIEAELARALAELRLPESACESAGGGDRGSDSESESDSDSDSDSDPTSARCEGREGRGAPPPYFLTVRLVRAELLSLDGSYGGIITDVGERQAVASVEVRVGSATRDNAGIFGQDGAQVRLLPPLLPAPAVTRKKLWLAIDQAYRDAARTYSAKQSILARLAGDPPPADLGPPPPTILRQGDLPPPAPPPLDRAGLRDLVADLSARFADHPAIDNGDVFFQVLRSEITTLTSEGTILREHHDRAILVVLADTRATDGMQLDHGRAIHFAATPAPDGALRSDGEALVDRVLAELQELAAAPMIDEDYDGPILFVDAAAPQLLGSTVATQALGKRAPLSEGGHLRDLEPLWQDRLGKAVMPDFIDLLDDPTADGFGSYRIDAEGYPGEPVSLVRRGVLETLLMTREPGRELDASNGHARQSPILSVGPAISNLLLRPRIRGRSRDALERELLRRAREDGYEFAYTIELLRDGNLLGPVLREGAATYGGSRKVNLPLPARIYRIEPGGKRTLVRGAVLGPASMRILRRIRAVGSASHREPLRIPVGPGGGFAADTGMDGILSHTVDVSITSPDLLVDGLEILVERGEHERLPTLVHPLRDPSWSPTIEALPPPSP